MELALAELESHRGKGEDVLYILGMAPERSLFAKVTGGSWAEALHIRLGRTIPRQAMQRLAMRELRPPDSPQRIAARAQAD